MFMTGDFLPSGKRQAELFLPYSGVWDGLDSFPLWWLQADPQCVVLVP